MTTPPPREDPTPAERAPRAPIRTCVVCRRRAEKRSLLRWVVGPGGIPVPDPGARLPGRGRYLCGRAECFAKLARRAVRDGVDFAKAEAAFRLALRESLVENVRGEAHEN
ncbi:MAG: YlxR family protein [bacterium]